MSVFWLKACPRCRGDMQGVRDNYGAYARCLNCGLQKELVQRPRQRRETGAAA